MSKSTYAKKSSININELPYVSYVNANKRNDLRSQRCISRFTPTMINYINSKINALYVDGVGIQCKDLADTLFGNKPERGVYEGLALAAFGLVATRSERSNRVYYVRISDIGKTEFAPDSSNWHTLTESVTTSNPINPVTVVKNTNSNKLSNVIHKVGRIFNNITNVIKSVKL